MKIVLDYKKVEEVKTQANFRFGLAVAKPKFTAPHPRSHSQEKFSPLGRSENSVFRCPEYFFDFDSMRAPQ